MNNGGTKTRNPEFGIRNPETETESQKRKWKWNTESNINDTKLPVKNFTLHKLVQSKENLL